MRKWMKGMAGAGLILLLTGTGLTVLAGVAGVAAAIHRWSGDQGILPKKSEMEHVAGYQNVKKLELKVESGSLQVVENEELTDSVEIYLKKTENGRVSHKNGDSSSEAEVEYYCENTGGIWAYGGKNRRVDGLIEIPSGYMFEKLEIEADAGIVRLPAVKAGELELSADAGDVRAADFETGILKVEGDAGSIEGSGTVSGDLFVSADAANVELALDGKEEDFNYQIEGDVSSLQIGVKNIPLFENSRTIDNKASKKASLELDASTVSLKFQ